MLNFIALPSGVFALHTRDFPYYLHGVSSCFSFKGFFGYLKLATAYTPKRIFTKYTQKDVVPAKDVPFVGPNDHN